MKVFATKISIRATPERIWALLTDAGGYARWNNTVEKVEGNIAKDGRVTVHPRNAGGRAFPAKVAEFEPLKRMVWSGGMPLGLFRGDRVFTLTPGVSGEVEFSMREEFTGLLAPLFGRAIPDLQPAFDEFARDLKRAAEAS